MKGSFTNIGIVCLALLLALGGMGLTYARWTDMVFITGMVETGEFNDCFSWVVSNDNGAEETIAPYGVTDPGDNGLDPSAPQALGEPCARYDKDVASTTASLKADPHYIEATLSNAYPCYWPTIFYGLKNGGTVTSQIMIITIDEDTTTPEVYPEEDVPELTVNVTGIYVGQEIDPGGEVTGDLDIHVEQSAAECHTYTISVKIWVEIANNVPECGECEGKVTQLTLRYNGSEAADIKVEQKKEGTVFEGIVAPGATFTFNGKDKKGTLGTEISIYVNGELHTKIHTSCSQSIGPGLVSGAFEVVEGYSRNGGLLCPITP